MRGAHARGELGHGRRVGGVHLRGAEPTACRRRSGRPRERARRLVVVGEHDALVEVAPARAIGANAAPTPPAPTTRILIRAPSPPWIVGGVYRSPRAAGPRGAPGYPRRRCGRRARRSGGALGRSSWPRSPRPPAWTARPHTSAPVAEPVRRRDARRLRRAVAVDADAFDTRWPIKHVVFLIKENRSFDNLYGTFPGADGATVADDARDVTTAHAGRRPAAAGGRRALPAVRAGRRERRLDGRVQHLPGGRPVRVHADDARADPRLLGPRRGLRACPTASSPRCSGPRSRTTSSRSRRPRAAPWTTPAPRPIRSTSGSRPATRRRGGATCPRPAPSR